MLIDKVGLFCIYRDRHVIVRAPNLIGEVAHIFLHGVVVVVALLMVTTTDTFRLFFKLFAFCFLFVLQL
jgi:hypothetical protein